MNDNKSGEDCQTLSFAVYVIWCRLTNMYYVGVTRQQVTTRIRQHKKGKQQFVDREIKRLGWDSNWDWWIVEEHVPADQISDCEQKWVSIFDCVFPKGYNKTCGGISKLTVSDDTCELIRQNALARNMSGENNPMYGKHHTDEAKAAMSAKLSGENAPNYGKHLSDDTCAKIAIALSGEKNPNYGKPSPFKGKKHTDETLAKMSVAHSGEKNGFFGKKHTEEAKAQMRQSHLGKKHTEETKALMREKSLARHAAKRAVKAVAEENLAAANTAPTNLTNLLDAVILKQGLRSEIAIA
ncbi:MAG: GIY-YIG nuclease family protein [Selenomonadaceae bacterium]|nr:GIY-YIG nuclease family protein [Selenomonadaceae bacterium]